MQELNPGVYIYADRRKHPGVSEYHVTDIQTGRNVSGGNYPEMIFVLRIWKALNRLIIII